jgi:hypothetical protein
MRAAHCISRRRRISSMSFSAKLCTRLRPCSLAAAQAPSAAERIDATSSFSEVIGTTPTLAESLNTRSSHSKRKPLTVSRSTSAMRSASSSVLLSSSTPYSSPPSRDSVSRQRILDFSSAPIWPSSVSPAAWPQESLIILNWSMSRWHSAYEPSWARALFRQRSMRFSNSRRFTRPVSGSWLAW